jgi:uncharacterized delta-60 repeat protein
MRRYSSELGRHSAARAGKLSAGRRVLLAVSVCALALTVLVGVALGAAGDLDPSFGSGGKVTTGIGRYGDDEARAVAVQGDGKIVAAGRSGQDFAVVRYNPNGTPDTTFSGDGIATVTFADASRADAVAIQPNGAIVLAGKVGLAGVGGEQPGTWGLARFNPNGTPDTSFDGDGKLKTGFSGGGATDVAVSGGKIVAVGTANGNTANSDFGIARYNGNGSLDASFDGDGKTTTGFGAGSNDFANGLAIQPNGRMVAAGTAAGSFALARYNAGGALDGTFSGDGKVTTSFGGTSDPNGAHDVAIQGDGAIVAAGDRNDDGFAVARFDPTGTLDPTFDGDGKQITNFGGGAVGRSVAIQGNGAIVVAGSAEAQPTSEFRNNFAVARYNSNGTPDSGFSGDGKQTTDFGGNDEGHGVAIQSGRIVVAGGSAGAGGSPNDTSSDFVLAAYETDGDLDPIFGSGGKVNTVIGSDFAQSGNAVAVGGDGRIVVAGQTVDEPGVDDLDTVIARYLPSGALDTSFHGTGKLITDLSGAHLDDRAAGVAVQNNLAIVVAGGANTGTSELNQAVVARFEPDGDPDPIFSGDGRVTFSFTPGSDESADDVLIQPNGAILAGGDIANFESTGLARFESDGDPDPTFGGGDGVATSALDANGAVAIALQSNGRIVAATTANGATDDLGVMRFTSAGIPDTSFSGDGLATADFGGKFDHGNDVAINPTSGAIVVAGDSTDADAPVPPCGGTPATDIVAARFTPAGNPDGTFGGNGKVSTDFGGTPNFGNGVAVQPDGATVVGGRAGNDFALARYKPNGNLDATFSGDGKLTTNFGGCDQANDVAIAGSKILAAGTTGAPGAGAGRFALARYSR